MRPRLLQALAVASTQGDYARFLQRPAARWPMDRRSADASLPDRHAGPRLVAYRPIR